MPKVSYVKGGKELIDEIKPLWQALNIHHQNETDYFLASMKDNTFEKRHDKFKNKDLQVYVEIAKKDKQSIGYLISSIDGDLNGEIDSLYVNKEYRKLSIGEELMNNTMKWFKDNNTKSNQLKVAQGNEYVLEFYKKFGFETRYYVLEEIKE